MELLLEFSHGFHFSLFNDGVSTVGVISIQRTGKLIMSDENKRA
jgi:hypothetical protein